MKTKTRTRAKAKESLMDAAISETAEVFGAREGDPVEPEDVPPAKPSAPAQPEPEPELPAADYITVRIPIRLVPKLPTVCDQTLRLTPRQARAQRLIYDGLAYQGENLCGSVRLQIGTTAPLWHATAYLLDLVADALGMAKGSMDGLA